MIVTRVSVVLAALAFLIIGVWALVDPSGVLTDVGIAIVDSRGIVEVSAMYGGLQLGMAIFLLWTVFAGHARVGLVAATLSLGGLGLVRTVSWVWLAPEGMLLPFLCALEIFGGVLGSLVLWFQRPRELSPQSLGRLPSDETA